MTKQDFFFASSDGRTSIHAMEIRPDEGTPMKGILQIVHGLSENCRIYEKAAEQFADNGYIVRMHDQIGHGKSLTDGQKRNYFGATGSRKYALEDIHKFASFPVHDLHVKVPYILLGHSLGGFLVREYLVTYGNVDAAIISGSGLQPAFAIKMIKLLLKYETAKNGYDSDSDLIQNLLHGINNKKLHETVSVYGWLTSDKESLADFESSSDIGGRITAGIFSELTDTMLFTQDKDNLRKMKPDTPLFFLAGAKDPSVDFGKGIKKAVSLYKNCGMKHVSEHLYPDSRHCIFQDIERSTVIRDILAWMDTI